MSAKKTVPAWIFACVVALAAATSPSAHAIGNCSWAPLNGDSQYFPIVISDLTKDSRKRADGTPCGGKGAGDAPAPDRGTCFGYVQCDGLAPYPVSCPRVNRCFYTNEGATDCAKVFAKAAHANEPAAK
jgi:hypothetical protein